MVKTFSELTKRFVMTKKQGKTVFSAVAGKAGFSVSFFWLLIIFPSFSAPVKYQVCSITINSADEIKMFRSHLSPERFEFVELLPKVKGEHYRKHDSHWLKGACAGREKPPSSCDIVVVSGHFGGTFFGESGYTLPTQLLEESACQKSCSGVLSRAKEVFLFGCNTMAGKKKDARTYTEYLNVLLDDGMARDMAERVALARYSSLGDSYGNRMKFVFSGSRALYGFEMLSPLGEHMAPLLKKYFQSVKERYGSYGAYMDQKAYLKERNDLLFPHVSHTSMVQSKTALDPVSKGVFEKKCLLYNEQAPFPKRVKALEELFHQPDNALKSFFAIDAFLEKHGDRLAREGGVLQKMRTNETLADEFRSVYDELAYLPYMQISYLSFLQKFHWVGIEFFDLELKKSTLRLIREPEHEAYESLLLLLSGNRIRPGYLYFSEEDFPENYVGNLWSLLIFEKLQIDTGGLQEDIYGVCEELKEDDPVMCHQALNTLAHGNPSPDTTLRVRSLLGEDDPARVYYALRVIGQSQAGDYATHRAVADFLFHEDPRLRREARDSIGFLKTPYGDIQKEMAEGLPRLPKGESLEVLKVFGKLNIQSEGTAGSIIEYVRAYPDDEALANGGVLAFENTARLPGFVLDHFYFVLDSDHNILPAVRSLSEMSLGDLGVDYRLARNVRSAELKDKREMLIYMGALTSFHPLAQMEMTALLRDPDGPVRDLAGDLFRNVENWTEEVKDHIRRFPENDVMRELAQEFSVPERLLP